MKAIMDGELQIHRIIAAYLLDRADQYETDSPCWISLADAADAVMKNEPNTAFEHGELDVDLFARVDAMKHGGRARKVDPTAGIDDDDELGKPRRDGHATGCMSHMTGGVSSGLQAPAVREVWRCVPECPNAKPKRATAKRRGR